MEKLKELKKLSLRSKLTLRSTIVLTDENNSKTNVVNFDNFDNFDNFKKENNNIYMNDMKKIMNFALMALLVGGLSLAATSCKDDDKNNGNGENMEQLESTGGDLTMEEVQLSSLISNFSEVQADELLVSIFPISQVSLIPSPLGVNTFGIFRQSA